MDDIVTYVRPNTQMKASWDDVPDDIKDTFDRLGIPEAEKTSLAGVGAQYDSEVVYHSIQEELVQQGVIYTDFETALREYGDIIQAHFMKLVPPTDHKFAALHGAVWSGGSYVYVPAGVDVSIPLQSYFRLNAPGAGQFEHTLIIVENGAKVHFIEGCSAPKYNVANLHAGAEIQRSQSPRRLRRIVCRRRRVADLLDHRKLVEEYVQLKYKTGDCRPKRHDQLGDRVFWFPYILPVPHEHPAGRRSAL